MENNNIILVQMNPAQLEEIIDKSVEAAFAKHQTTTAEKKVSSKLTRQQLKDEFHISYPTILKNEKKGILKSYRFGKRVLFDRSEVEASLQERRFTNA
jgi:hypothetical protein